MKNWWKIITYHIGGMIMIIKIHANNKCEKVWCNNWNNVLLLHVRHSHDSSSSKWEQRRHVRVLHRVISYCTNYSHKKEAFADVLQISFVLCCRREPMDWLAGETSWVVSGQELPGLLRWIGIHYTMVVPYSTTSSRW